MTKYHVLLDPHERGPPDRSSWTSLQKAAWMSPEMEAFREGLRLRGLPDIRSAVLDDLSSYFHLDAEACVHRARYSQELSSKEWLAKPERMSEADITDFFLHLDSYVFGTLWYSYLQAEGFAYPVSVVIARDLACRPPGSVLDFGSGVGATAQMFGLLGYQPALADISAPLLDFARYRLERRCQVASFIDLNTTALGDSEYDVITAIQTLASVPNLPKAAALLHRALRPQGRLYADIDASPRLPGSARLYDDDLPPRRALLRGGFAQERNIDGASIRYRRVSRSGVLHALRGFRDAFMLGEARRLWRRLRHAVSG